MIATCGGGVAVAARRQCSEGMRWGGHVRRCPQSQRQGLPSTGRLPSGRVMRVMAASEYTGAVLGGRGAATARLSVQLAPRPAYVTPGLAIAIHKGAIRSTKCLYSQASTYTL